MNMPPQSDDMGTSAVPHKPTPDRCTLYGGHCFEPTGQVLASNPPQYPEQCKHCTMTRIGTPQPPMNYRYPSAETDWRKE